MSPNRGLRAIAIFEASKGIVVLAAGVGALRLLNGNAEIFARRIVHHLELDPAGRYTSMVLDVAAQMTNTQVWMVTAAAAAYCLVRLFEAYGLWRERAWAEWFAIVGAALYIPFEIKLLISRPNTVKALLLAANVLLVVYIAWILAKKRRKSGEASASKA